MDLDSEVLDFQDRRNRLAQARAALGMETNPDDAAKAMTISSTMGTPAPAMLDDVKGYELAAQQESTRRIIEQNPALQAYVNGNPMAAHVSNDDYLNLSPLARGLNNMYRLGKAEFTALGDAVEGFKQGYGHDEQYAEYQRLKNLVDDDLWRSFIQWSGVGGAAVAFDASNRVVGAAFHGAGAWIGSMGRQLGMSEQESMSLAREIPAVLTALMMKGTAAKAGRQAPLTFKELVHPDEVLPVAEAVRFSRPWIEAKEEPPAGVHPLIDDVKKIQTDADAENLDQLVKGADKSTTKERSPEMFKEFVGQQTDAKIGISLDAIRELYKGKVPEPDDGLLGWVPGLAEKLAEAEQNIYLLGTEIEVPLADFLAADTSKVYQPLKDYIRVRPGGETPDSIKNLTTKPRPEETDIQTVRRASGVDPIFEPTAAAAEVPKTVPMEEREIYAKAAEHGLTVEQYKRWKRRMDEENAADKARHDKRVEADAKRRLSKEWKENEVKERERAVAAINLQPEVQATRYFREGLLPGGGQDVMVPKIDPDFLKPGQAKSLPMGIVQEGGIDPNVMAGIFGFRSGAEMIDGMIRHEAGRREVNMQPMEFTRQLIKTQTDMFMEERYGKQPENLAAEVKEHALSRTTLDRMREEQILLAEKAGAQLPLPDLRPRQAEDFGKLKASEVSSKKALLEARRAADKMKTEMLGENWTDAFQLDQARFYAAHRAQLALEFEKAFNDLKDTFREFRAEKRKGVLQEFTDAIQIIMNGIGLETKRTVDLIRENFHNQSMTEFGEHVKTLGYDPALQDWVEGERFKPLADMTVEEVRQLKDAIDSLEFAGREENKVRLEEGKVNFDEYRERVLANIRQYKPVKKGKNWRYAIDAPLTRVEEIVKDLDLRQEFGPLFDGLIRPMAESKHTEYKMMEALSKRLTGIRRGGGRKWLKSLKDKFEQDFFLDDDGTPYALTREDLINIGLNMGTKSNWKAFIESHFGHNEAPINGPKLEALVKQHLTKQDWEFVQDMWDTFKEWREPANRVYRNTSGLIPKWIPDEPVVTPHGTFDGGYWPIFREFLSGDEPTTPRQLFEKNYFRSTPTAHYTKSRIDSDRKVSFQQTIEQAASRMQQMIHDISYREAVMQANKILNDKQIMNAIRKHYGEEYAAQLKPWVADIANHFNQNEVAITMVNKVLRRVRFGLMAHSLGLNLKVIASPDVGLVNPKWLSMVMASPKYYTDLAWENSREIPHTFRNMDRDFRERLELTMRQKGIKGWEADSVRWGFYPLVKVSQGFRITTFVMERQKALDKGFSVGEANNIADSYVRERHGSAGLPDMPAVMRGTEALKTYTFLYGYFNTMYNWQRQIKGGLEPGPRRNIKTAMAAIYGAILIPAAFNVALFNEKGKDESWFHFIGRSILQTPMQYVPFLRDAAEAFLGQGNIPKTMLGSIIQSSKSGANEIKRYSEGKPMEKPIQHGANILGPVRQLPLGQLGRTGQFLYDVETNKQRPRDFGEWIRGIIYGEARPKR